MAITMRHRLRSGLAGGLALFAGSGVGLAASQASSAAPAPSAPAVAAHLDGTRTHLFSSVAELARASDAVVRVSGVGSATTEIDDGIPVTITRVTVAKVLRGPANLPRVLVVRQFGSASLPVDGAYPVDASVQVLFLQAFHLTAGDDTGQWIVTGGSAGAWHNDGQGLSRRGNDPDSLPTRSTLSDIERSTSTSTAR